MYLHRTRVASTAAAALLLLGGCAGGSPLAPPPDVANPAASSAVPGPITTAPLPDGFQPEGIDIATIDGHDYAYTGSMADGSIFRTDLSTGRGEVLSPPAPSSSIGLEADQRGRLFVAGGLGGAVNGDAGAGARVIDARSGQVLASYKFSTAPALVNDVTVTRDAAWFTDTINPVVYKLPLGADGSLPGPDGFQVLPITGQYQYDSSASTIDGNGIASTPDGSGLLVIQYQTGLIYRLDTATGATTAVDLGGQRFPKGDGLTLDGSRLYVPQNTNVVAVLDLNAHGDRGRLVDVLRSPSFDVPTNVARSGDRLYLPTSRLQVDAPRTAHYSIVSVPVP